MLQIFWLLSNPSLIVSRNIRPLFIEKADRFVPNDFTVATPRQKSSSLMTHSLFSCREYVPASKRCIGIFSFFLLSLSLSLSVSPLYNTDKRTLTTRFSYPLTMIPAGSENIRRAISFRRHDKKRPGFCAWNVV